MYNLCRDLPVKHIIQIGDLYDLYCFSRYDKNPNFIKPVKEIEKARECAETFWNLWQEMHPKAKCWQVIGNHDQRLKKLIMSKMPELYDLIDMSHLWSFDGVRTQASQRDELIIDDIVFVHGHYSRPGQHLTHNMENTAYGHSHKGSCIFKKQKNRILWEINAGCLADLDSVPLGYTAQAKFSHYMNGFAIIDELGPRFIPLVNGKTWQKAKS